MKKVLVTGATGFLGKYVVEELSQQGYQVRAFGRNRKVGQSLENSSVAFFQGRFDQARGFSSGLSGDGHGCACGCSFYRLGCLGGFLPDKCLRDQVCSGCLPRGWYSAFGFMCPRLASMLRLEIS